MNKLKFAAGMIGGTIILGNLALFFIPAFQHWLGTVLPSSSSDSAVSVPVFLMLFFVWGGGLMGIMAPLVHVDCESSEEKFRAMWLRLASAISIGGLLAWYCLASVENVWDWSKGPSVVTMQFFISWSFTAGICLLQEVLPLLRHVPRVMQILRTAS